MMLYSFEQTESFAESQSPAAELFDLISTIRNEHYSRNLSNFPNLIDKKGVRAEKYAEK